WSTASSSTACSSTACSSTACSSTACSSSASRTASCGGSAFGAAPPSSVGVARRVAAALDGDRTGGVQLRTGAGVGGASRPVGEVRADEPVVALELGGLLDQQILGHRVEVADAFDDLTVITDD